MLKNTVLDERFEHSLNNNIHFLKRHDLFLKTKYVLKYITFYSTTYKEG